MTSISEGLPMSVLEAMSQGRPIVSTCVGGVPDVVKGCGALAAPGDDHALAMAVVMLLRNPELALAARAARPQPARADLQRARVRRGLPRAAAHARSSEAASWAGEPDARARRLVEARLGRPPQDALEAAVVLEAWAGVPAQRALETARALMPRARRRRRSSARAAPATAQRPPGIALEGAAFLVTVVAIALWAEPLAAALGVGAVERALGSRCRSRRAAVGAATRATSAGRRASRPGRARRGALVAPARRDRRPLRARARRSRARSPGC